MKLKFRSLTLTLLVTIGFFLAGCGGGGAGNTSPENGVFNTTKSFLVQWGKHNVSKAMSYVSKDYYESGMDYYDLRDAIESSSRFEVTNFKITTYDFDAYKEWCSAYVDCYTNGQHMTGWIFLHKHSSWLISGQDGRALRTDSIVPKLLKPIDTLPASDPLPPPPDSL